MKIGEILYFDSSRPEQMMLPKQDPARTSVRVAYTTQIKNKRMYTLDNISRSISVLAGIAALVMRLSHITRATRTAQPRLLMSTRWISIVIRGFEDTLDRSQLHHSECVTKELEHRAEGRVAPRGGSKLPS